MGGQVDRWAGDVFFFPFDRTNPAALGLSCVHWRSKGRELQAAMQELQVGGDQISHRVTFNSVAVQRVVAGQSGEEG